MKNIHILPTSKPSRLFKFANELHLDTIPKDYYKKYNIYITSNEEIKEEDWFYNIISLKPEPFKACENGNGYVNCNKYSHNRIDCKKIILTTDQDLIKNGVQAIDDEFLEWFVKNPSCERVELTDSKTVKKHIWDGTNDGEIIWEKEIIIPQEEPKQEMPIINGSYGCIIETNKQETLEEAAEKEFPLVDTEWCRTGAAEEENLHLLGHRKSFISGAKWQQEQDKVLYDDLIDLLERLRPIYREDSDLHLKYEQKMLDLIEVLKKK
jgi:hypothetical protein